MHRGDAQPTVEVRRIFEIERIHAIGWAVAVGRAPGDALRPDPDVEPLEPHVVRLHPGLGNPYVHGLKLGTFPVLVQVHALAPEAVTVGCVGIA